MNTRNCILVALLLVFTFHLSYSQKIKSKELELKPYIGLSSPVGDFKDFSESGSVFGIAIDKYFGNKFALGIDFNFQTNSFKSPYNFSSISSPYSIATNSNGNWNATTFTFGPTYKISLSKFNIETYAKGGISLLKTPTENTTLSALNSPNNIVFNLKNQKINAFGFTTGLRFNYTINNTIEIFINPQYTYSSARVEYFNKEITEELLANPDIILEDAGKLCTVNPSFFNVNAGITLSLGGNNPSSNNEDGDYEESQQDICKESILKSPYNGKTYFSESGIVPTFNWINHSKPKVKSYVFELYYGEERLFEKKVKQSNYKFSKKMILGFYGIKDTREYSWRVKTNYDNCESTVTDFNYFIIAPINSAIRSQCNLDISVGDIYCSDPAYSETGMVKYGGTFTIKNNTPDLPGVLIPHPNALGPVQLFGTNNPSATLTFSQGGFPSPCSATPMLNTSNGPALRPNSDATFCFELEVPYGTNSIKLYANMNTYDGGELPAECPDDVTIQLPVCVCDSCDNWDFTDETHNYSYDSANNNPYISHSIRQSFKLPASDPIRRMKAEVIYVKHKVDDPNCYDCTTEVKDMGLFSAVNGKPKDLLANPLDWVNNNQGILGLDKNNDGYSNMLNWRARNPVSGVDFANRRHNFNMYINLPGENSLECCNHEYEVWIRYTFEDINCVTCSTVIKYDLSASQSSSGSGTIGIGSGGISTGISNQQSGQLSPTQLTPQN